MNIEEITEDEVKRAVDRSRNGKSPGCDIIPHEIYKTRNKAMICRLTKLFNTAYSIGSIPVEWGKAEICPIYKHKGDYLKCENYRGMSLMCHVAKLPVIDWREIACEFGARYLAKERFFDSLVSIFGIIYDINLL